MEDIISFNTDELVCPHCGYYLFTSSDIEEDEGLFNCVNCGEEFFYRRNIFITYDAWKSNT